MALSINKNPQNVVLSGNPAKFVIASTTTVSSNHKIHVRIKRNDGSGWETIGEEAKPVINNAVEFDISDYLKLNIKLGLNIFNFFSQAINTITLAYTYLFDFFETYNNDGIEHNTISWGNLKSYQGGFSTIFLNDYNATGKNFYDNLVLEDKKFLTWSPSKKLTWNQHDILFFLVPGSGAPINIFPRYEITFSDGTTQTIDRALFNIVYGTMHWISTSYLIQGFSSLETPTKKIVSYTVQILAETTLNEYSEKYTYYIDHNKYSQSRQFIFKNSLAGYDVVHLKGVSENTNEIQRTIGFFETKNDISFSEFTETFEAASGFLVNSYKNTADAQRYIIELFNSQEIYEIIGKEFVPVIPGVRKVMIKRDRDFLYSYKFEYEYAYSDRYFAPFDTAQYFNPIISYKDGVVTNSVEGQNAVLNFKAMINADIDVTFEIDWGFDIGTTQVQATMEDSVWQTIQSSIAIPIGAIANQTAIITDSIGNTYSVNYTVQEAIVITTNQNTLQTVGLKFTFTGSLTAHFSDGSPSQIITNNVEFFKNFSSSGNYNIAITGDTQNISGIFCDNSRISNIKFVTINSLTNFQFQTNLLTSLDLSKVNVSGVFFGFNNYSLSSITFSNNNGLISYFYLSNTNISSLDLSNVAIKDQFNVNDNSKLTSIIFKSSGNQQLFEFQAQNSKLSNLDLSSVPIRQHITCLGSSSLSSVIFSSSGNSIVGSMDFSNCNLSTLDLSSVPVGTSLRAYNNSNLSSIIFKSTGNSTLTTLYLYGCNFTTIDLSNIGVRQNFYAYNNYNLTNIIFKSSGNGAVREFHFYNCKLGVMNWGADHTFDTTSLWIRLENNSMNASEVNENLVKINNSATASGAASRVIYLHQNNSAPDNSSGGFDGLAAKTSLQGKGFSVTTN